MELLRSLMSLLWPLVPAAIATAVTAAALTGLHLLFERRKVAWAQHRVARQLLMMALSGLGVVILLIVLPIDQATRTQLLQLLGLLVSAVIAFSSTSFVGNAMAGLLLRALDNFRPGDFLQVGEHFGRVSERGLFHTEIQTEDRDLTTLPNLYLVTNPVKVVRSSGTIVSSTVSLGYDIHRTTVDGLLLEAARTVGLDDPFVQVMQLGDFAVTYRVAGLLPEVKQILSARSQLRAAMLDTLHGAGVEIVSPAFMNQRVLPQRRAFIPTLHGSEEAEAAERQEVAPEEIVFDKADKAESREKLKKEYNEITSELEVLAKKRSQARDEREKKRLDQRIAAAEARQEAIALEIRSLKEEAASHE